MLTNFQLKGSRFWVDVERTKTAYSSYPTISDNCNCGDCVYFEQSVIKTDNELFNALKRMGVDLVRQPNDTEQDGVCCIGDAGENKLGYLGYLGYYNVWGKLDEEQLKNDKGEFIPIEFTITEDHCNIEVKILQINSAELKFSFYIECEAVNFVSNL